MRKYFKGTDDPDGWMLAHCGKSTIDNKDWLIDTNSLHGDEIPNACNDAKTFSQLVSGLLNLYYNNKETKGFTTQQIIYMGIVEESEKIPHPDNPKLPF